MSAQKVTLWAVDSMIIQEYKTKNKFLNNMLTLVHGYICSRIHFKESLIIPPILNLHNFTTNGNMN